VSKSKETWLPDRKFAWVLNFVFILAVAPIVVVVLRTLPTGFDVAAWAFALFYAAGAYHGTLIGDIVDEYGRIPAYGILLPRDSH